MINCHLVSVATANLLLLLLTRWRFPQLSDLPPNIQIDIELNVFRLDSHRQTAVYFYYLSIYFYCELWYGFVKLKIIMKYFVHCPLFMFLYDEIETHASMHDIHFTKFESTVFLVYERRIIFKSI